MQASISVNGFDSITDFQISGSTALKEGLAAGLGAGISAANVIITQVCQGTSCVVFRRLLSSSVSATFQIISQLDPSLMEAAIQDPSFSSVVSRQMIHLTGKNISVSSIAGLSLQCASGFFEQSASCTPCTVCDKYVLACGATFNAHCETSTSSATQNSVLTIAVSVSVVSCALMLISTIVYYKMLKVGASRRLIGAATGTPADQRDLPKELRRKYKAERVVGTGSFGVVLEAWQVNNGKRVVQRAVKIVHATRKVFSDKEIRALDREV
jgi:hypothetical protein